MSIHGIEGGSILPEEQYHTIGDVRELLQVSERTVHRWIQSGDLPAYKPRGEWRIRDSDLTSFIEARRGPVQKKAQASTSSLPADEERRKADTTLIASWAIAHEDLRDELQELLDELPSLPDNEEDLGRREAQIYGLIKRFYSNQDALQTSGASERMWPYVEAKESREYLLNDLYEVVDRYQRALKTLNKDLIPRAERWRNQAEEILEDFKAAEPEPAPAPQQTEEFKK
jgi:excisionase family DNA binding protein